MRFLSAVMVLLLAAAQAAAAESVKIFNIPELPLREALVEFAEQANVSVGIDADEIGAERSSRLIGSYPVERALQILLSGTNFGFSFVDEETVRIDRIADGRSRDPGAFAGRRPVDSMIVTAARRAINIQQLPMSVGLVTGDKLDAFGWDSTSSIAPQIAGVFVTNLGPGQNKIFIRGLSDGTFSDRTRSTVGVYWDETPIIFNDTNPDLRLIDVDRVEFIRGPQGTLYGEGSLGGTYRVITNKPEIGAKFAQLRATGSVTADGGPNGAWTAILNAPIVEEKLAVRMSGYYEIENGYIDDVGIGESNTNDLRVFGGRLAARAFIADDWTVDVSGTHQTIDLENSQYYVRGGADLSRMKLLREPYKDNYTLANITLNGRLPWADLLSSSSYTNRDLTNRRDATLILPLLVDEVRGASPYDTTRDIRSFVHETRLVSRGEMPLDWLLGVFYSRRDDHLHSYLRSPRNAPQSGRELVFAEARDESFDEIAGFAEFTAHVTKRLAFTGGMRGFHSKLDVSSATRGTARREDPLEAGTKTQTGYSPKVVLSYQATEDFLLFAQATRGNRAGGINLNTPISAIVDLEEGIDEFEPDTLWNLEFGLKTGWLDERLTVNASVFRAFWQDIQSDQILDNGFTFIANAGDARMAGVEVDLKATFIDNLEFAANFFWNEAKLIGANPFLGAEDGSRLPGIPKMAAGASIFYRFDVARNIEASVAADYSHIGKSNLTFDESDSPQMGGYHLANFRVQVEHGSWLAGLFATNIFNDRGNTFAFGNSFSLPFEEQVSPPRPLTVGLFVEMRI